MLLLLSVDIANNGLCIYILTLHCCLQCRPAWTFATSAPIFSAPAVHSHTSTIFVAAVAGSLTALSHTGHPLWHCTLGSRVFAPLCCLPASSSAAVQQQQLLDDADSRAEPCSAHDQPLQASKTDWEADAAAAVAAATATAESQKKHSSTNSNAVASCGATVAPGSSADSDGAMLLIGTSSGMLHCISCSSGQQLWQMHTGGSVSTAAGFCPAGRAHAPSDAPADDGTDAFGDSLSRDSAAAHEQMQTDPKTDSQTDSQTDSDTHTQADCSLQHQQQSWPRQQTGMATQTQLAFDHILVLCSNSGAVRVLSLPAVACPAVSLDQNLLQSGQRAATCEEEVQQSPTPPTWAAAQMPGECMVY